MKKKVVILELDVFRHFKLYTYAYTSAVSLFQCFLVPEYWYWLSHVLCISAPVFIAQVRSEAGAIKGR